MISYVQQWNRTHDPLHTTSLKGIQLTATYSTDTNKLTEVDELYIDCWWLLRADHIECEITNDQLTSPSHFWHHLLTTHSFLINTHSPLHLFPTTLCYWLTTKHTSNTKQKLVNAMLSSSLRATKHQQKWDFFSCTEAVLAKYSSWCQYEIWVCRVSALTTEHGWFFKYVHNL